MFADTTHPNHVYSFLVAEGAVYVLVFIWRVLRFCVFCSWLHLFRLAVWLFMDTSSVWIDITSQKTILIRVLTIRTAETWDLWWLHHHKNAAMLLSARQPLHTSKWQKVMLRWRQASEILRQAPSSLPFIQDPHPPRPRLCWRASSQLPGHVHGAQSGLITVYTWHSQLLWETRKMWCGCEPNTNQDGAMIRRSCAEGGAEGVWRPNPNDAQN